MVIKIIVILMLLSAGCVVQEAPPKHVQKQPDSTVVPEESRDEELIYIPRTANIGWVRAVNDSDGWYGRECGLWEGWCIVAAYDSYQQRVLLSTAAIAYGSACQCGTLFWLRKSKFDSLPFFQHLQDSIDIAAAQERAFVRKLTGK